jgi:hypothetical protein
MIKNRSLLSIVLLTNMGYATVHACDTVAAFVVSAGVAHHFMSKRTIEQVRAHAQQMVDDYENRHGLFTIRELRDAYQVLRYTDEELRNRLWWGNKCGSLFFGLFGAVLYHALIHPSKNGGYPKIKPCFAVPISPIDEIAAPRF